MTLSQEILQALQFLSLPEKVAFYPRFFKTGKGEYGEGDQFLGVVNPDCRSVVKEYWQKTSLLDLQEIIQSPYHEMRLVALLIAVAKFEKSKDNLEQKKIVGFYLKNTKYINNWDLVDLSCYKILGKYCFENEQENLLRKLSHSENLWEKRIAVVSTMYFVKRNSFELSLEFILKNLYHPHDLMHKANGWLLREIGKKNEKVMHHFLHQHYTIMPRTSLRYAIEKLDENLRQDYLKGRI